MSTTTTTSWKSALLWTLILVVGIVSAGWFAVSCGAEDSGAERPVTDEEAQALAGLPERNFSSDPVAVRMTYPVEGEEVVVDGFVDWRIPMLYARTPGSDGEDHLVQTVPGLVASRADDEAFDRGAVPDSGWATRQMLAGGTGPLEATFDVLVSSLFTLSAPQSADPSLVSQQATWRDEGLVDGEPVDTFQAPIMVESDAVGPANPEALYSLDDEDRLRRFQVNTGGEDLATVDILRDVEFDTAAIAPVDLLGGPAIEPGEVDTELAEMIAAARGANWEATAAVEMTVPVADGQVSSGHGYVDWRTMTAYLNITDAEGHRLVLARPGGMAHLAVDSEELPEQLPADGWETLALGDEDAAEHFGPLETLTYRLLETASEELPDADKLVEEASLLRVDTAEDEETFVVEFPIAGDATAEAGRSAFRYHLSQERIQKVEMMTQLGVAGAELSYGEYPMTVIPWSVSEEIG